MFARRKIFEIGIIRFRQAFVIVVVGFGTGKMVETGRCGSERLFVILVVAFARETFVTVLVRFVMFLGTMLKIAKCDSERILQFSSVSLREKKCWKLVNMVPRSFCNCCWIWKRENV